ncbi:hypothetical protein BDZ91DRAFT_761353 [Kalaharituber pfeilii]|nr:hypothetical protein BDZ91DRAFT_761353 [Kalaharituber pfeilii]
MLWFVTAQLRGSMLHTGVTRFCVVGVELHKGWTAAGSRRGWTCHTLAAGVQSMCGPPKKSHASVQTRIRLTFLHYNPQLQLCRGRPPLTEEGFGSLKHIAYGTASDEGPQGAVKEVQKDVEIRAAVRGYITHVMEKYKQDYSVWPRECMCPMLVFAASDCHGRTVGRASTGQQ